MAHLVWLCTLSLALIAVSWAKPVSDDATDVELRMPGVQPTVKDTYLCLPMKMKEDGSTYITGFVPHGNMTTAHHMLLFGCEEPGHKDEVWSCGEMESDVFKDQAPVCKSDPKIVYAWAMDAPELKLPQGVGFKVGGKTDIKWLVLQVHYKDVSHFIPPENNKDHSGLTLHTTSIPQPKTAGVYLLSTGGEIPPKSTTYMEAACSMDEPEEIHPFAYRVHAHVHGQVVSGYRVRDGQWTEIGRMSPKQPQMFYNVTNPDMTVDQGDVLAARCTMVNDEDRTVMIGQTQQDEMCNFYVMYWVNGDHPLSSSYCTTMGPPNWYWNKISSIHVENSPQAASIIPGTDQLIQASQRMAQHVGVIIEQTHQKLKEQFLGMLAEIEDGEGRMEPEEEFRGGANDIENELRGGANDIENELPGLNRYSPEEIQNMMYDNYRTGNGFEDYPSSEREWMPYQREAEYPYEDGVGNAYYPPRY